MEIEKEKDKMRYFLLQLQGYNCKYEHRQSQRNTQKKMRTPTSGADVITHTYYCHRSKDAVNKMLL